MHLGKKLNIIKWLHALVTTVLLFKKFHSIFTKQNHEKLSRFDHARICHVSLFMFIYWFLSLSSIYSAYLTHLENPTEIFVLTSGFHDTCIMQYLFIFSTYISQFPLLKNYLEAPKVLPISS
ncbi:hypothetical protein CRE_19043 [Caenorhabditis remanei]|uniref:Uncharacterized protein n=1 Tax=Caenorhabditis remanei TaxID=31234 RepID=E3LLB7_CAERE|nr:hypothetical protein CRE_19043 [Caenorhabditis remanei]